jgi:hypothetical protein
MGDHDAKRCSVVHNKREFRLSYGRFNGRRKYTVSARRSKGEGLCVNQARFTSKYAARSWFQ